MNPTQERWLPVPGYEGYYEVSDHGRVRSLDRTVTAPDGRSWRQPGVTMTTTIRPDGYSVVMLSKEGKRKVGRINMLVLEAFVGPRPDGFHACHNDGDCTNNTLANLRWDSLAENNRDMVRHGVHNNASKTHCPAGHAYTPENTYVLPARPTARYCRACKKKRDRDAYRMKVEREEGRKVEWRLPY